VAAGQSQPSRPPQPPRPVRAEQAEQAERERAERERIAEHDRIAEQQAELHRRELHQRAERERIAEHDRIAEQQAELHRRELHQRAERERTERQLAAYRRSVQLSESRRRELRQRDQEGAERDQLRILQQRDQGAERDQQRILRQTRVRQRTADHLPVEVEHSMQDTEWQQMQEGQSQQRPQQFDERAVHTNMGIDEYRNDPSGLMDACTFMPASTPDNGMEFMIDTIREMEKVCRQHIALIDHRPGSPLQGPLVTKFYNQQYNPDRVHINMQWMQDDGITLMPLKYFASVISSNFISMSEIKITLVDSPTIDAGGVSRSVFSKAGEYIQSICMKEGNRYFFGQRMPKDSYDIIVGCIIASLNKGFSLSAPLSYGILYCINRAAVPSISDMELPTLMALMARDDPDELQRLITSIGTQQDIELATPYHKYTEAVLPKSDGEAIDINMDRRYEWLKRILYHNLFGRQKKHLEKFLASPKWAEGITHTEGIITAMRNCQLDELAIVLGTVLTKEAMDALVIRRDWPEPSMETMQYVRDYINANEDKWTAFLRFITGSADPNLVIKVDRKDNGLPTSSTCFNRLHLRTYTNYEDFAREMDISLTGADDMSLQ